MYLTGDEDIEEAPRRDGTEENSIESDEEKRVEVSYIHCLQLMLNKKI